jgi:chromosome segregation ATPase
MDNTKEHWYVISEDQLQTIELNLKERDSDGYDGFMAAIRANPLHEQSTIELCNKIHKISEKMKSLEEETDHQIERMDEQISDIMIAIGSRDREISDLKTQIDKISELKKDEKHCHK